jgi:hypothetical protein
MDYPSLAIPLGLSRTYLMAVSSATLLFLLFFIGTLISRGRRGEMSPPLSSPSWLWHWLIFIYPEWLDKLAFRQILLGFVWALASAAVTWLLLAVFSLMLLAKPHG